MPFEIQPLIYHFQKMLDFVLTRIDLWHWPKIKDNETPVFSIEMII